MKNPAYRQRKWDSHRFRVPRFRVRFRVPGSGSLPTTEPEPARGTRTGTFDPEPGTSEPSFGFHVPRFQVRFRVPCSGSLTDDRTRTCTRNSNREPSTRNQELGTFPRVPRSWVPGTVQGSLFRFTRGDRTRTSTRNSNREPSTRNRERGTFLGVPGSAVPGTVQGSLFRFTRGERTRTSTRNLNREPSTRNRERGTFLGFRVPRFQVRFKVPCSYSLLTTEPEPAPGT